MLYAGSENGEFYLLLLARLEVASYGIVTCRLKRLTEGGFVAS